MNEDNVRIGLDCLDAYAAACRGSWADLDGRSIQSHIKEITGAIRSGCLISKEAFLENTGICGECGSWDHCCWCEG